jgi:hypothetical protein
MVSVAAECGLYELMLGVGGFPIAASGQHFNSTRLERLYCYQDKLKDACRLAASTKQIQIQKDGAKTPEINYKLWGLARIYALQGRKKDALQNYLWALKGYTRLRGAVFGAAAELATEIVGFLRSLQDEMEVNLLLKELQPNLDRRDYDRSPAVQNQDSFIRCIPERDPINLLSAEGFFTHTSTYTMLVRPAKDTETQPSG